MEVLTISKLDHQLNEEIQDKEVRLIGEDGSQLGIVSAQQANEMAEEQGLDLVKISPNAVPPVCKIMDYSKFCFDQKKREKEAKKNQKVVEIKEIRMSPSIDTTIMASAGAHCDHLNHVSTQLPYAITAAVVSFVSYIIAGFVRNAWIALPVALVLMIGTLYVIKIFTKEKAAA